MNGAVHVEKEHEQVSKRGYKMSGRTWKRVGHGRKREVRDGRRGKRREEMEKVSIYLGRHVTEFLTNYCMVAFEW